LGAMRERVYQGRKFYTVDQLNQAIVLECRTATDHGASLITTADNGNVVCSVSWIKMVDKLNILTATTVKLLYRPCVEILSGVGPAAVGLLLCTLSAWIRRVEIRGAIWRLGLSSVL